MYGSGLNLLQNGFRLAQLFVWENFDFHPAVGKLRNLVGKTLKRLAFIALRRLFGRHPPDDFGGLGCRNHADGDRQSNDGYPAKCAKSRHECSPS